jgi:hypothetical protein
VHRLPLSRPRAEAARLLGPPITAIRTAGFSAIRVTLVCTAVIGLFALIQHYPAGWWLVERVAGVYQALPLPLILLRLPLSMFAPAPDLPAWGAMLQVLIVFGFAEVHLGRLRTLLTAVCVNGLTTLAARIMVIVGLHLAVGTPQVDQYELDTGPSTVVVALAVYVALKCRAHLALGLTAAAMAGETVALPNLAGREHLVALALGVLAYLVGERLFPRRPAASPVPAPPTAPAPAPAPARASAPSPAPATAGSPRPPGPGALPRRPTPPPGTGGSGPTAGRARPPAP